MDIQIPIMDGLKATMILKGNEETSGIPIVVMTAYAMKGDEEKILEAGCDEYITKPIDTRRFLQIVSEYFPK